MELSSFPESNIVFDKPKDMTYEECSSACAFIGHDGDGNPVVVTCWKPTYDEIDEIIRTGRIWCTHIGTGIQPHLLHVENPFENQSKF